jgi:hypothetical protein
MGRDNAHVVVFEIGSTVVLRDFQADGRIRAVECGRVVAEDELGTAVWVGGGSTVIRRATLAGEPNRHLPVETKLRTPTLPTVGTWHGFGVLILTPPDAAHCVWWLFTEHGEFDGWYVNLQTPARRWWGGIDLEDQTLDVLIAPDRTWRWKDEEDAGEAAAARAEAHRVIALAEAHDAPFDGRWCDFRPDPSWPPTDLPWWWDLPRPDRRVPEGC